MSYDREIRVRGLPVADRVAIYLLTIVATVMATLMIDGVLTTRGEVGAIEDASTMLGEPAACVAAPHDWTCVGRSSRRTVVCPRDADAPCRPSVPNPGDW